MQCPLLFIAKSKQTLEMILKYNLKTERDKELAVYVELIWACCYMAGNVLVYLTTQSKYK